MIWNSLQQEGHFVQLITPDVGTAFGLVKEALQEDFLLKMF